MSYDGEVRIRTALDNSGLSRGVAASGKEIDRLTANFQKQTESIKKQNAALDDMRRKLAALETGEKAPASLLAMERQLKRVNAEVEKQEQLYAAVIEQIEAAQERLSFAEVRGNTTDIDREKAALQELDVESLRVADALEIAKEKAAELSEKITQVKLDPSASAEAQTLRDRITLAEEKLNQTKDRANEMGAALRDAFHADTEPMENGTKRIGDNSRRAASNVRRLGRETRTADTHARRAATGFERLSNRIGRLVAAVFVFNVIRRALRALADYMGKLLQSNDEFMASWNAVKVNLLTAFAPIWEVIQPALVSFMNVLAKATQMLATFIAMLFGKTYQQAKDSAKAIDAQAKSMDKAGGSAKKASKQLHAFDEINQQIQDTTDGGGGGGEIEAGLDFEVEEPKITMWDKLKDVLQSIADLFMTGFWEGFASADLSKLKDALEGIGKSLKEIFTDPEVVGAANRLIQAWIYNLGRVTGSLASIGVSVATAIFGGINKFLEANKDSIKKHLVSLFNIEAEILNIWGDFFVALADIFTVLAGENAQTIVAAVLGIFYEIARLVNEIAARIGRDFLDLLTAPIIANKDKIKQTFDNIFGYVASILQTVKDLLQYIADSIIALYDGSIKPFIDSVKAAFTEWFDHLLDGWNTYIQPVLDNFASKFKEVVEQHIKPMIDKAMEVLGKLFDFLKHVWDTILKPFVTWMIDFFAPIIGEALNVVGVVFNTVLAVIGDVINGILQALGGLIDFVSGVFTGDWEKAWDGIKNIFKGIWNGIVSVLEGAVNLIIKGINWMIDQLNKISITMPDWLGGGTIGFNISHIQEVSIPRLATGGVVGHGIYELGENGAEAVVPLENNTGWINAVASKMSASIDNFQVSPQIMNSIAARGAHQNELSESTIAKIINGVGEQLATVLTSLSADTDESPRGGDVYLDRRKVGEIMYDALADVAKGRGIPFVTT